ncbi:MULTISPECIES: branched-chain amino acid ABC transporter permease [Solidesulfovibrio]|uniref:branched-chain amino acid ABC transporter permease n=1 Tax=Solidesulfovibrio TaxID=2910984 RepID=UPI0004967EDC|nr:MULTISPECIES: branched-chain amino acid ABC transporter permease [Solidesulfovibrio]MEA5088698.1 branched-chain amino acid ABC transporter permease [Solidesulfovibrio sp.]HCR12988.1 branched-chain amino acid ABC transporter permease [Desulfovibrio sp.]HML61107.1 branched-chain amino acid ABC transporter permease [Solidesulfovibrio sp.]
MNLATFIQNILNSLTLGSLYALVAIGYTMVYGILRLINFAHSEIFMLGAYFVFWGITLVHLPWPVAMVLAILVTASLGVLVDQVAYRPLRDAPRISALISSIGVSFFLQNVAIVFFQAIPREVYRPQWLEDPILFHGVRVLPLTLFVPLLSLVLMLLLIYIVYRTKTGLGMRAISKDIETSYLMGVPVNRVIAITFGIGSALAAASGIMWALRYPQLQPIMGTIPGFKAFIAAVFGGIGSIQGAVIGGLTLGFIEIMTVAFFPDLAGYRDAFAFVLLILVLMVKPTGLLGERPEDKV